MANRYWTPTRTYDFRLIIKDKDYTADLQRASIITSLTTPYQTVLLDIFIDANDMILDKIYGQDKLKLQIRLLAQGETPIEEVDFELMLLNINYEILMKSTDQQDSMKDRSAVQLITVCRKPFQTMSSIVNSLAYDSTPSSMASALIDSLKTKPKTDIDQSSLNSISADQILVPPMTFYKAIQYLDDQFGIYQKGILGFGCLYDNTIYLKNLSEKVKRSHTFTINYLATDLKQLEKITQGIDGQTFYTWNPIDTLYKGNTVYSYLAPRHRFIVKPRDLLYSNIDVDIGTAAKDYGIVSRDTKIFYDTEVLSDRRRTVHIDHTGYEDSENFINFPDLADMSTLSIELSSKNITLLNFMFVGEAAKFNSKVPDYAQLAGKYIIKSSELRFERIRDWESYATVNLIRTNRATI